MIFGFNNFVIISYLENNCLVNGKGQLEWVIEPEERNYRQQIQATFPSSLATKEMKTLVGLSTIVDRIH